MCTDVQSVETDPKVAKVTSRKVKMHQRRPRSRNSSYRLEVEMAKRPEGQKRVSYKGNDTHATKNVPFEPLEMWSREVTFWRVVEVLGGFKDVAASFEGETVGDRDGGRTSDVDDTIGGGDGSNRLASARLAAQSQYMRNNATGDETTYSCRPSHPQTLECLTMESFGRRRARRIIETKNVCRT